MDILFDGVGIDCSSEQFEASSFCSAMENEKAINVVNDTYLTFSILGSVSCVLSLTNDFPQIMIKNSSKQGERHKHGTL